MAPCGLLMFWFGILPIYFWWFLLFSSVFCWSTAVSEGILVCCLPLWAMVSNGSRRILWELPMSFASYTHAHLPSSHRLYLFRHWATNMSCACKWWRTTTNDVVRCSRWIALHRHDVCRVPSHISLRFFFFFFFFSFVTSTLWCLPSFLSCLHPL